MSFPNIESAQPAASPTGGEAAQDGAEPATAEAAEMDDGFTPEERRKNQLEEDAGFKKYMMMKRMKIPLHNIRAKIR